MNILFPFFVFGIIVAAVVPAWADPIDSAPSVIPDASTLNQAIKDKGNGVPGNVPVGDFDSPSKRYLLQQPSGEKGKGSVKGKPMHTKNTKQIGVNNKVDLPVDKIISSPKPSSSLIKSYKQRKSSNGFTPRVGDFGPHPHTVPNTKVAQ